MEDTRFDFDSPASNSEQTVGMTPPPLPRQDAAGKPANKKGVWKQVAVGSAAGLGIGAAAIALTSFANPEDGQDSNADLKSLIDDDMDIAKNVTEDMSFSEAFAAARAEVGPGGCFMWHGTIYGTYYANEWNSMSAAERAEFEGHFSWGAGSHTTSTHHTAHSSSSVHTADSVHTTTSAHAQATAHTSGDYVSANSTGGHATQVGDGEIRVISMGYDNDLGANVGIVEQNGMRMMFVDVDNDNEFEYAIADVNGNQQIEDEEVIDISDKHITMQTLQDMAIAQGGTVNDYDVAVVDDVSQQDYKGDVEHNDDHDHVIEAQVDDTVTSADVATVEATPVDAVAEDVMVEALPEDVAYEPIVESAEVDHAYDTSSMDMSYDDTVTYDDPAIADTDLM